MRPVAPVVHQDQAGQHVRPLGEVGGTAALADLGVDQLVEPVGVLDRALPRPEPLEPGIPPPEQHGRADVDGAVHAGSEPRQPRLVRHAEDHAQDDLEGERVHPVEAAELLAGRPARDLVSRDLLDQGAVGAQCVAVERRHQQRPGTLVLRAVLQQERVLAHDRAEDRVPLAGVEDLGVAGEDLLGVLRPGEQHQRAAARDDPDGEDVAVLVPHVRDEAVPEAQQAGALEPDRPPRTRRETRQVDARTSLTAEGAHPFEAARGQGSGVGLVERGHGGSVPAAILRVRETGRPALLSRAAPRAVRSPPPRCAPRHRACPGCWRRGPRRSWC